MNKPTRLRRTAEEARLAILDAAEQQLVTRGPNGIRLQDVAAEVGISHPTILHHFGSREGLVEAVVFRALDSLYAGLFEAVQHVGLAVGGSHIGALLDRITYILIGGHARAFMWLVLSGHSSMNHENRLRELAEAVHQLRLQRNPNKSPPPTLEDTYFTILLPAASLLTLAVFHTPEPRDDGPPSSPVLNETDEFARFRTWLGQVLQEHLDG